MSSVPYPRRRAIAAILSPSWERMTGREVMIARVVGSYGKEVYYARHEGDRTLLASGKTAEKAVNEVMRLKAARDKSRLGK